MKRSKNVRLVLAAGTVATTTILAGCGETPPTQNVSFTSVTQCVAEGFLQEACEDQFRAAGQQYLADAPRFASLQECQTEFGTEACGPSEQATTEAGGTAAPAGTSGGSFMPFMTGFLVSQAFQNMTDRNDYRSYRDRHSGYYSSAGYYGLPPAAGAGSAARSLPARSFPSLRTTPGSSAPAPRGFDIAAPSGGRQQAIVPNTRTSVISTGGFGGRSAMRGGSFSG